ncbi:MAG: sigma-54 dependent transcriptional regulator [Terriglobales bacterium]
MTTFPIPSNYPDHVLVASPSTRVRQRVLESLRSPVRRFEQARGGAEALAHLESGFWQVLFLDRRLPDLDAEELSATVRQRFPGIAVVLLDPDLNAQDDAEPTPEHIVPDPCLPLRSGPAPAERNAAESTAAAQNSNNAEGELPFAVPTTIAAPLPGLPGMIGNSRIMQPVYRLARLLAPRNTSVLISGPTGCGKEVLARAIHQLSPRAARTFAVVNCAAIPETLLEAELFGYARGAFTGATQTYAGRIQAAQGGTLFLDEIGEMPLSLQPKLLRFLEQKELQRLGSAEVVRVDARVISATNAHLLSLVREGKFREDLYYRLCGFPIEIPPLRDRSEDIVQLSAHFLEKYAAPLPAPQLSLPALQLLKNHPWAGNIRELQSVIERALILSADQAVIGPEHLLLGDTAFRTSH